MSQPPRPPHTYKKMKIVYKDISKFCENMLYYTNNYKKVSSAGMCICIDVKRIEIKMERSVGGM